MKTKKTTSRKPSAQKKENTGKGKENEQEFPGYPKYSADEDITRNATRIDENLDDEVLTDIKHNKEPKIAPDALSTDTDYAKENENDISNAANADTLEPPAKDTFDVTDEDLEALGPKDLSIDMGDDEQLKHRTRPVDFTGNDLDVPGTELDDDQEEKGSEDEENNSYSLGGDGKSDLDEGQEHEGSL